MEDLQEEIISSDTIFHLLLLIEDYLDGNKLRKVSSIIITQNYGAFVYVFEARIYTYA